MRTLIPLLAVVALGACGGSSSTDTTQATDTTVVATDSTAGKLAAVTIDVTVGTDSGKDRVETVALGSQVTLNITNPATDDEFHLHGYDLEAGKTPKGETATISFTADKAGEFEVESHITEELIMTIVVK